WTQITTTGGASLGACYQQLAGADPAQGFNDFVSQLATLDQGGQLSLPQNGNPFPIGGAVPPVPPAPGGTGAGGTPSGTPPGVPPMPSPATPMPNSPNSPLPVAGRPIGAT
ncbi:MAG TPA: hypothetical protein VGN32_04860, partial [Ktedonobacterales bacterium]|nr:hypothetical protein [Ktedonobacterales bacterium]